jgi:hypothetical protein
VVRAVLIGLAFLGAVILGFGIAGLFFDLFHVSLIGFLLVVGLIVIWVGALFDLWRRADISTGAAIIWTVVIVLFPLLGTLIYVFTRPADANVTYKGDQPV